MKQSQQEAVLQLIGGSALFASLPAEGHRFLAANAGVRQYAKGDIIGTEGERRGYLFGVLSGRLRNIKFSRDGQRIIFRYMDPGDWAGFFWAYGDSVAVLDVEAIKPSSCVLLSRGVLDAAEHRWPTLYKSFFLELLKMTRPMFSLLELSVASPLRVRVAAMLLSLTGSQPAASQGSSREIAISQADLASMAFCSRQHVSKVLGEWADAGVLSIAGRKTILLHKPAALAAEIAADRSSDNDD